MSTRFTQRGTPLVESQSLQLIQSTSQVNNIITKYISKRLVEKGYTSLTPSLLSFLSILECGVNYGAEIARNLGVTRQMVAKTVKELCKLQYLEQRDGIGKQKEIVFTETGEYLMADARLLLSDIDEVLNQHLGDEGAEKMIAKITAISDTIDDRLNAK
ncbi:MarR family transcriptional regulator [Agaribacter marinus]|uniref:MarR family transcriptional regulator n=1 Tax=Agaribacter marinus TaxID=1431249 RepID=A0AA37WIU4_9ALTE|nr:MarR family transcriptional regulator [Agaribacter marinus]GLR72211.1 hypothetical protein GCM10007852_31190 [Agaribacter marinus]